jgi:carboxymethylenebutenolidase
MARTDVTIRTADGECAATLHVPPGGSGPGVLVYPDAAGARETFAVLGDQLAELGFVALVPDVYYRTPFAPFDPATVFGDPDERARLGELTRTLTPELVVRDADALLGFLLDRPEVTGAAVGTTGYCMGGRASLLVAAHHADRVGAAASFHGGNLAAADDPGSPHLVAERIRARVYVAAAQDDRSFPAEQHERLAAALAAAGVEHRIETYPAAHGFAVPDNATYDAGADRRHRAAMAELFGAALSG